MTIKLENGRVFALEKPGEAHKQRAHLFKEAFFSQGETVINGSAGLDFYAAYEDWLAYIRDVEAGRQQGFVPSLVWFAVEADTGQIAAVVDVRPRLPKEKLAFGHLGYAVAPAFRRQGLAAALVQWAVLYLKQNGVNPVVACCYQSNEASKKTLQKCGFIPAGVYNEEDSGKKVAVYNKNE